MLEFRLVTAKDNQTIKLITLLQKAASARKEKGLFVLEGLRLCSDAAVSGIVFETLVVSSSAMDKYKSQIEDFARNSKDLVEVGDGLFKRISDTVNPQGVLAIGRIPDRALSAPSNGRYVALEHISDPSNIGAVARTAEALGVSGLIISGESCDVYSPKALRASMGTVLRLPVFFCDDLLTFLSDNSLRGFACVPDSRAQLKLGEFRFSDGDAVIIGNEANGISKATIEGSYKTVTINMRGKAESLNAASAASIAMWELLK